jgi:hypothetical protein
MQDFFVLRQLRFSSFHNTQIYIDRDRVICAGEEVGIMHLVETKKDNAVPVSEKYMLTIKEAAAYFNIGIKKLRRIAEDNLGTVAVYCGNRFLIIRPKFEEFILNSSEI